MTAGLILAAGTGARFGAGPKQLAPLGGRPLLQWAIDAQCGVDPARLHPIVLVLGARADEVRAGIDPGRARVVVCERWHEGQSASLRDGLAALAAHERPVLVTLGDAPLVAADVIARFAAEAAPARAVYAGRPGHPVLLADAQVGALLSSGDAPATGDEGARSLLRGARTIEIDDPRGGADVDTPADLRAVAALLSPPPAGEP